MTDTKPTALHRLRSILIDQDCGAQLLLLVDGAVREAEDLRAEVASLRGRTPVETPVARPDLDEIRRHVADGERSWQTWLAADQEAYRPHGWLPTIRELVAEVEQLRARITQLDAANAETWALVLAHEGRIAALQARLDAGLAEANRQASELWGESGADAAKAIAKALRGGQ